MNINPKLSKAVHWAPSIWLRHSLEVQCHLPNQSIVSSGAFAICTGAVAVKTGQRVWRLGMHASCAQHLYVHFMAMQADD